MTLLLNFLPCAIFPGVQPLALAVVNGLRRWRPENGRKEDKNNKKHQYICYRWRHCINKLDILSSPDLNDGSFISLDRNLKSNINEGYTTENVHQLEKSGADCKPWSVQEPSLKREV